MFSDPSLHNTQITPDVPTPGSTALGLWDPLALGQLPPNLDLTTDFRDSADRAINFRDHVRGLMDLRSALPDLTSVTEHCLIAPAVGDLTTALVLLRHQATHSGKGPFGKPDHKPVMFRSAAEIVLSADRAESVLLIQDQASLLRNVGTTSQSWSEGQSGQRAVSADPPGATPDDSPWGATLAEMLRHVMDGDLSVLHRGYDPAAELCHPGQNGMGPVPADRFWLSLRAAFPRAAFSTHCSIGKEEPLSSPSAAVRWSLSGAHDGWGRYGAPSGVAVHFNGLSFAEFGPRGLRREWTILDDTAVWRQIRAGRSERPA